MASVSHVTYTDFETKECIAMSTYDFTHVDFSNSDIAESLGRAYKILLERALQRSYSTPNEENDVILKRVTADANNVLEPDTVDFQDN